MSSVATGAITVAEFEQLVGSKPGRHELRHGEVIELTFPKPIHKKNQRRLVRILAQLVPSGYVVDQEVAFRPVPENELWAADVAVTALDRIVESEDSDEYLQGSPEIVIEVISPSNSIDELDDRRITCFEGGCREFWVVNPRRRTVQIFDRDGNGRTYTGDQAVPVSLAGASFPASSIFA